jgi:hypothetical protein
MGETATDRSFERNRGARTTNQRQAAETFPATADTMARNVF